MNDDTRKSSTSWAVVNKDGEVEHSDDCASSSSGSTEYVHLDGMDEAASYYHWSRGRNSSPELLEPECDGSVDSPIPLPKDSSDVTAAIVAGVSEESSSVCDIPGDWAQGSQSADASNPSRNLKDPDVDAGVSRDVISSEQAEDESHPDEVSDDTTELITEIEVGSDNEVSSIEVLSIPSDGNDSGDGFTEATEEENGKPRRGDGVEGAADLFRSVSMDNAAQEPRFADEDPETLVSMEASAQMDWLPLDEASSMTSLPRTPPREPWRQCSTESDSDQSDFVKLSPCRTAEGSTVAPSVGAAGGGSGGSGRMEASTSSALTSSGSSISSSFRFVRPVLPAPPLVSRPQHPVLLERPHYQYQPQQPRHPDDEDDVTTNCVRAWIGLN